MSKATFPIITCDHDDCTDWTLDWYRALAHNWRVLMRPGWEYDPHSSDAPHLCPRHAKEADES